MKTIKNLITKYKTTKQRIITSWTWNHKHLLVTLALAVVVVIQSDVLTPHLPSITFNEVYASTVTYEKPEDPLEVLVEKRALEMYQANREFDLENYRQEALRDMNSELIGLITDSPFVDYEALREQYGY